MAHKLFEKKYERKVTLDDTQEIVCYIETAQNVNGHTEYVIRVQRGPLKENSWRILRRYNEFAELKKSLQLLSHIQLDFPGKRYVGNMRPDFIAERRYKLQEFINTILMNPILASSLSTKKFVDPDNYSQSFHDNAVQNASLCLRTDNAYALGPTIGMIGWRLRKHYFKVLSKQAAEKSSSKHLVKSGSQSNQTKNQANGSNISGSGSSSNTSGESNELVLTWTEFGPDKYIDDKEMHSVLKSLMQLKHPYIEPIKYAASNDSGCLIVRNFYKQGSLKDLLCMSTPKNPYLSKYGNCKNRSPLTLKQVAIYGRQIIEALRFLHSKGMPYGHLQTGNIIIIDDTVRLLDVENFILGVPAFYRPFFVQHSKIHSAETIDVYCFGHVLFEMSMGYPLQESIARQINDCPENLKNLLESILSKDACRTNLPTLKQLAEHKFFTEFSSSLNDVLQNSLDSSSNNKNIHFKLSTNAKEQLKVAIEKSEIRLTNEQKSVKNQKRLVRVQELMSSEEEKKKSKQKAKLEHKQSKLKQQASLQMQNGPALSVATASSSSFGQSTGSEPKSPLNKSNSVNVSQEALSSPPSVLSHSPIPPSSTVGQSIDESDERERNVLLESICRFNRSSLRKVRSNDD